MTVKPRAEVKLLNHNPVPSMDVIRFRMAECYGTIAPLMNELVQPCAEVAERMLYQLKEILDAEMYDKNKPLTRDYVVMHPRLSQYRSSKNGNALYQQCPSCRSQKLRTGHNFCPNCGIQVFWAEPKSKGAKKKNLPHST